MLWLLLLIPVALLLIFIFGCCKAASDADDDMGLP